MPPWRLPHNKHHRRPHIPSRPPAPAVSIIAQQKSPRAEPLPSLTSLSSPAAPDAVPGDSGTKIPLPAQVIPEGIPNIRSLHAEIAPPKGSPEHRSPEIRPKVTSVRLSTGILHFYEVYPQLRNSGPPIWEVPASVPPAISDELRSFLYSFLSLHSGSKRHEHISHFQALLSFYVFRCFYKQIDLIAVYPFGKQCFLRFQAVFFLHYGDH